MLQTTQSPGTVGMLNWECQFLVLGNLRHCWSLSLQWLRAVRLLSTAGKSDTIVAEAEVFSKRCATYLLGPSEMITSASFVTQATPQP